LASFLDRAPRRSDSVPGARAPGRTGNARAVDATQRPLCAPVPAAGLRLYRGGRASRGCRSGHRADRVTRRGWALFAAMAVLVGLNVSFKDLRSVGEVGLVALGYAAGPIIIARRLPSLPAVGVVAASLVLTALFYSPVAIPQLPNAMPSSQVLLAVLTLAV